MSSTSTGYLNPQGQRVVRKVRRSDTFAGQFVYELLCERMDKNGKQCGHRYGANGCDIKGAGAGKGRLCPVCQGGQPGESL
jgi:hypothetical protein